MYQCEHRLPLRLFAVLLFPAVLLMPQSRGAVIQKGATFRLGGSFAFSAAGAIGDSISWRLDRELVDEVSGSVDRVPGIDSARGTAATFSLLDVAGKRTEYTIRARDAGGEDSARVRVFPAGVISTLVYPGPNNMGKPVRVFIVAPPQASRFSRVVAVMHGVDRNAVDYIVPWVSFASLRNRIVIAPEFTSALWPFSRSYNLGNMFTDSDTTGSPIPEPQWTFSIVEEIAESVRQGFLLDDSLYDIWGHSAGAQFVHRMVLSKPLAHIRLAIASNAGSYTVTDTTIVWPYGVRYSRLGVHTAELFAYTRRPLVVMRGTADTVRDSNLDISPEADAQGLTRFARAGNFVARAKALNPNTSWGFYDVPGVNHDQVAMSAPAQELLARAWPPPARTLLYTQSFGTTTALPPGWVSSGAGWSASTANGSFLYVGASGGTNMNGSNAGTATSTLTFLSGLSATAGATIAVRWGARRSTSFTNPMVFEWSPDGVSWQQITYVEAPNTTTWMRVNNGDEILLTVPPAGGPAIAFRWTFTQANNGAAYRFDDFEIAGTAITDVAASCNRHPAEVGLLPNYPNPFNPATRIPFRIYQRGDVALDVFDVLGRHVASLVNGFLEAGEHDIRADMSGFSSGAYIVRLATGGHVSTIRMLLVR
jgi:hypothetical protein